MIAEIRRNPPMKAMMPPAELEFLEKTLQTLHSGQVALEWGSGGSTFFIASRVNVLYSIENQPRWCDDMERKYADAMNTLRAAGRLVYLCANRYAPTAQFGYPADSPENALKYFLASYIEVMDTVAALAKVTHYDFVLVDGRYRLACLMHALKYIDADTKVLIHDFERFKEDILTHLPNTYELVGESPSEGQRLGLLRKKGGATFESEEVQKYYAKMILSPGP
ncbi:unnamed protein product [Vitrella brassicaformis CCMP3155]|uniref:Class I SAM-dependent methyltransferase n=1 Tax=Vitrella brassicaformis (strain CCMP3155) TaxID=1169540 RepID=A0A0G4EA03_VITBC|nr:unnamed protein product [Vitrella brassicaformis CCMP3155]|eukprot:CEL92760.1 unnamed protein product [Vitrella brassicaformis CCMP3155]